MQTRHLVSLVLNRTALLDERVAFVASLAFDVTDQSLMHDIVPKCEATVASVTVGDVGAALALGSSVDSVKPVAPLVAGPWRRKLICMYVQSSSEEEGG